MQVSEANRPTVLKLWRYVKFAA